VGAAVKLRILIAAALILTGISIHAEDDPYEAYIKTSKDFKRVKQDPEWLCKAWPTWIYMPWCAHWDIGFNSEGAKFAQEHGYNGGVVTGKVPANLDWYNQNKLRFYRENTAAKGFLYLKDSNKLKPADMAAPRRAELLNDALLAKLKGIIKERIDSVKDSPFRTAYGLDDEISWGSFVKPCFWQVTDDESAYKKWLEEIYGKGKAPNHAGWIGYNDVREKLPEWTIGTFDASQLMDELTFNDSHWNNFLGDLVDYANSVDPEIPVGYEGAQSPNAFGGFDYAKLTRKVQWLEPYNIGGSLSVFRSFNPKNAMPAVTTYFFNKKAGPKAGAADGVWQAWFHLAHGNRGMIGWVEGWFDKKGNPAEWHKDLAPSYKAIEDKIAPLQIKSTWMHDGVAIYYSHASIQLGWIMDAEAHGSTWPNRNGDARIGSQHLCRHAWENMLRDEGLQYNYISYVDVVQDGIPKDYKVLILPGVYCLSDVEASRIRDFCKNGGTVLADYLPGCWDQHGKGRAAGGALDDMFGVKHDPIWKAADIFGGKFWCETDQEANFEYKAFEELLTKANTCIKDPSGFYKAVRSMGVNHAQPFGAGKAVLMNLSPQWYNAYRVKGSDDAKKREVFMQHVKAAGCKRWIQIQDAGTKEFGYEITYWQKDGRTLVFICSNVEVTGDELGGGNAAGLKTDELEITVALQKEVSDATDERTGKSLGNGSSFKLPWKMNEAAVLSFK
jgi:hypothetical protein